MTSRGQRWDRGGGVGGALALRSSIQKLLEKIETTEETSRAAGAKKKRQKAPENELT